MIPALRLRLNKRVPGKEICHYVGGGLSITSRYRSVYIEYDAVSMRIDLPRDGWGILGQMRLVRRAIRLDKCNVHPVGGDVNDLVIVRRGVVYHLDGRSSILTRTLTLSHCRNVLHQAICSIGSDQVFLGEYGANPKRREVPVYRSTDAGRSWNVVFRFPAGSIKHVHGCYWDPYGEQVWVLTGDFDGECFMVVADRDFKNVRWIGDGSQAWRACNVFFESDRVVWVMDSQLEDSRLVIYDRATGQIKKMESFPGPVWYIKRLTDGYYLAGTACEIGPGVKDSFAHLLVSHDLENWSEIARFRHDRLPKRYFKFGVIGFADGSQSSESFYLFGEALKGLDGRVFEASLTL